MSENRRGSSAVSRRHRRKKRREKDRKNNSLTQIRPVGIMLHAACGNIADERFLKHIEAGRKKTGIQIDTIVNAAKPTLMGSSQGVDGAIHKAIDSLLQEPGGFNKRIQEELDGEQGGAAGGRVRCERGKAVMTKGYGLCSYVIHAVGTEFDEKSAVSKKFEICSSSRIRMLESCYREIVQVIRAHPEIKNVAVPIIGSGNYGFPFEMAAKIAITGIGNALVDWQRQDGEYFNSAGESVQNIYFCVWDNNTGDKHAIKSKFRILNHLLALYRPILNRGRTVVAHYSPQSQLQYLAEIRKYDRSRGYFCIAKMIRVGLAVLRFGIFWFYTYLKDIFGGRDWQRRRFWVEMTVVLKILIAVGIGVVFAAMRDESPALLRLLLYYNMADTVTYLISLILMADIQKPSANVIRSMLLLLLNYVEVSIEMACLYFLHYEKMTFLEALQPGLIGELPDKVKIDSLGDHMLYFGNTALKFFFLTLAFGYLAGHLRQRTFRK